MSSFRFTPNRSRDEERSDIFKRAGRTWRAGVTRGRRAWRRAELGDARGTTLVELLTTLGLAVILAAMAVPIVGHVLDVLRGKGASEQVASALRQTRQLAITASVEHCITLIGTAYEIRQGTCPGSTLDGPVPLSENGCFGSA